MENRNEVTAEMLQKHCQDSRRSAQKILEIASREQDVASTVAWPLTSVQVRISLSRETLQHRQNRKRWSGRTPLTHQALTYKHMLKGEQKCVTLAFGLSQGCGPRGNGCFPSLATALWLNWSGLLDLSVRTRLCAPIKHLLKQTLTES